MYDLSLPASIRVRYEVHLTSHDAGKTIVLMTSRLSGPLRREQLDTYIENNIQGAIQNLNDNMGVTDFRLMTSKETELYVQGFHIDNLDFGAFDADLGFRH